MSIGDVVQYVLLLMQRNKINLSLHDRRRWHEFFYELKNLAPSSGKPEALTRLFFDWNDCYPRAQELDEYLGVLGVTGCTLSASPSFRDHHISEGVAKIWERSYEELTPDEKAFFENTVPSLIHDAFDNVA